MNDCSKIAPNYNQLAFRKVKYITIHPNWHITDVFDIIYLVETKSSRTSTSRNLAI
ncbi:hypothetical protein SAMN05216294_1371 [Flagellimonas zhangzhouensis]|nr:hypothetical protein SAMN05216294_1371 [Allomuricauda zhangzhouensis]